MKNLKVNFKAKTVTCKMFNYWSIFHALIGMAVPIATAVLFKTEYMPYLWTYSLIVGVGQFFIIMLFGEYPVFRYKTIPVDKIQKTAKRQILGFKIFIIQLLIWFVLNLYPLFCIILSWTVKRRDIIFDYFIYYEVGGLEFLVILTISFIILVSIGTAAYNLYYCDPNTKDSEPFLKSGLVKIAKEERESGISFWKRACKEQNDRGVAKRQRRLDKEEKERRYKELVASLEAESPGYNISSSIDFSDKLTHEFRVYGAIRKILIMGRLLAFEDILSYSTSDDPETHTTYETVRKPGYSVTTTRKRGVGTRAALGHMMFGKAGALVGALTADEESTTVFHDIITEVETGSYTIHNFKMTINIRDEKAPTLTFNFDNNDVAFKMLTKVLDAIITQNLIEEIRRNTENPEPTDQLSNKQE